MAFLFTGCYQSCPWLGLLLFRRKNIGYDDEPDLEMGEYLPESGSLDEAKVENQMEVFENSDDKTVEEPFDAKIDHLRISTQYSDQKKLLIITIIEAGGEMDVRECREAQVRVALLGDKTVRKRTEFTTGPTFKFAKTFAFKIEMDKLPDVVIRMRLYRKRMPQRNQLVGECFLKGKKVDAHSMHILKLRPPIIFTKKPIETVAMIENGDIIAQKLSNEITNAFVPGPMKTLPLVSPKPNPAILRRITAAYGSEVFISLAYSDEHETFHVAIEKTSAMEKLKTEDGKSVDCFFQIIVRSNGAELCRHRSKILSCTSECEVGESVVVPCSLKELHDITVIIGLFCVSGFLKRRALIGFIRMGADEMESADAAEHWTEMVHDIGRSVERWHNLRRPKNLTL
ncbi:unnamed protein product [Bursaphelenchus okinawaensis]|uniref:C2 domain-containing protein n=1 Tax=Bursaphelenchus okinawaensis TaxID=465554 RepID=A0A811LFC2_9BILA|nr:unnamed protein product [Bursaphelenchus okinawaensis]CAG9121961.1 unnamed protein product [Bursaphelenchus okinawaensis]